MITGEIKSKVDRIWTAFWTGGISNPLTVIEQFSYLIFIKRLDDIHTAKERQANKFGHPIKEPIFSPEQNKLRWSHFRQFPPEKMFQVVSTDVFKFIKELHQGGPDASYSRLMKDAIFMVPTASLLEQVVEMISDIPMEDRDTKGDLYEYLLSKLSTAGVNGQFRTPRHIIRMMVEMVRPTQDDMICDPACGTAGFLVGAGEYLREKHPNIFLDERLKAHFSGPMFTGFDFDQTMLRIGSMNMMLHGIETPHIQSRDSLSQGHSDLVEEFSLILANPPFKGALDESQVAKDLSQMVKTKKTELLFIALFLRLLKKGGRCACIVPDGVLFGSTKAHVELRKELVEKHRLQAVVSMPSGVFKPYAGVSTAILFFTKTGAGGTDKVWFYDMQADGFSLDDKRNELDSSKHENNNIPDILARWGDLNAEAARKRTEQSFFVDKAEIAGHKYDLSINRYKEVEHQEQSFPPPKDILDQMLALEEEIHNDLLELRGVL